MSAVVTSTVTTVIAMSVIVSISVFVTVLLIGLLVGKEILGSSNGNKMKLIANSLIIGIVPLVLGFMFIIGLKIADFLALY